jgi:oligopeptidase B
MPNKPQPPIRPLPTPKARPVRLAARARHPRGTRLPASRKRLPGSLPGRPGPCANSCSKRSRAASSKPTCRCPPWGPYLYYTRTTAGDEYPRHYRCPRPADDSNTVDESQEQLLLDPNALANGGFLSLGAFNISPDHRLLAYSLDTSGDEIYTLYVKDLASGSVTPCPSTTATAA